MWISLDRFTTCNPQDRFIIHIPGWFEIQSAILAHLSPAESHRYLRTCVLLVVETRDLTLTATAIRIQYSRSGYAVRTPPVQPQLQLAGQEGGVWNQEFSSDFESSRSAESDNSSHAVESQHSD